MPPLSINGVGLRLDLDGGSISVAPSPRGPPQPAWLLELPAAPARACALFYSPTASWGCERPTTNGRGRGWTRERLVRAAPISCGHRALGFALSSPIH
uniref:Uncharacterized protein n=1 Tax=Arundo donax TaxID=35708 RepID=A0A0A9DQM2_ARUDO